MRRCLSGVHGKWWISAALGVAWLATACGEQKSSSAPRTGGASGSAGAGGIVDAVPVAGKSGAGGAGGAGGGSGGELTDACLTTPPGKLALIDDFDDGDSVAAFEPEREAYWFTIIDDTEGTLEPSGEFLPVADGYRGSKSAHVSASGFSDWGAALAVNLSHKTALRCPFNASGFAGLRFVARGHGRIRVQLGMPEVVEKEFGGKCDSAAGQACYDNHGIFITLEEDFTRYELPWEKLMQRGFGDAVAFNPKTIMMLHFSMEPADLPVDLWLDQVELWDGTPAVDGAGGAGGAAATEGGAPTHLGGQTGETGGAGGAGGDG